MWQEATEANKTWLLSVKEALDSDSGKKKGQGVTKQEG